MNEGVLWLSSYPPFSVGVRPNKVQSPTDMSRELRTVTTAASAKPHLDFTMSIFPVKYRGRIKWVLLELFLPKEFYENDLIELLNIHVKSCWNVGTQTWILDAERAVLGIISRPDWNTLWRKLSQKPNSYANLKAFCCQITWQHGSFQHSGILRLNTKAVKNYWKFINLCIHSLLFLLWWNGIIRDIRTIHIDLENATKHCELCFWRVRSPQWFWSIVPF